MQNVDASFGATSRPGRTASGMWERDGVTDAIIHVLDQARRSKGEALFVIGEAGLGKTSLLELARRSAGPDFWIGTSVGDPAKTVEP